MPKSTNWENTCQLEYVLEHEYVHIKRLDAVLKLTMAAALCLHWFNPPVWIMYLLFNRDIELSCDEAVIRTSSTPENDASFGSSPELDLAYNAEVHSIAHKIYQSERFSEYEKFGLSYDHVAGYLMYDNQTVGYFKDEYQPHMYTRFTDKGGRLGVIVTRNDSGEIVGLKVDPAAVFSAGDPFHY